MRTTIDKAGRIVIPKVVRDELGLDGGGEVEIELLDGRMEIAPVSHRAPRRCHGPGLRRGTRAVGTH